MGMNYVSVLRRVLGRRGRVRHSMAALVVVAAFATAGLATAGPAAAAPEREAGTKVSKAVSFATAQIGKPYRYGGNGPASYDCSGLVQQAYKAAGVSISRTTYTQFREGTSVARSDLRPGDLVFFYSGPSHVGMYIGGGRMVHAPSSGKRIQIVSMSGYYDSNFVGARRIA